MTEFQLYFSLGREHILDVQGYDHILFVIALCSVFQPNEWKKVLILVTAFTIGHSLTLALVVLDLISVNADIIEFLIPVTILITAIGNILTRNTNFNTRKMSLNYFIAVFFGLIHGMGFSNYLKAILGSTDSIITELFAFNLGLEIGQVIIVTGFMLLAFIFITVFGTSRKDWILAISSAVAGIAITLML